jgi:hypothetical protein
VDVAAVVLTASRESISSLQAAETSGDANSPSLRFENPDDRRISLMLLCVVSSDQPGNILTGSGRRERLAVTTSNLKPFVDN